MLVPKQRDPRRPHAPLLGQPGQHAVEHVPLGGDAADRTPAQMRSVHQLRLRHRRDAPQAVAGRTAARTSAALRAAQVHAVQVHHRVAVRRRRRGLIRVARMPGDLDFGPAPLRLDNVISALLDNSRLEWRRSCVNFAAAIGSRRSSYAVAARGVGPTMRALPRHSPMPLCDEPASADSARDRAASTATAGADAALRWPPARRPRRARGRRGAVPQMPPLEALRDGRRRAGLSQRWPFDHRAGAAGAIAAQLAADVVHAWDIADARCSRLSAAPPAAT